MFFNYVTASIKIDLENLKRYAETIETSLSDELTKLSLRIEKEADKLEKEARDDFYEYYEDDYWQLSKVFPNILRYSLFTTCYSLLEHNLNSICRIYQRKNKYPIELDDLSGKGIFKAKVYIKKVICIGFPDQTVYWGNILKYNYMRNCIIHSDGKIDENNKRARDLKEFINHKKSIGLDEHCTIQLGREFCPEVVDDIENFFNELFKILPK